MMFLSLDDRTRGHLARAIAEHLGWCRRNAIAAPPELSALLDTLTARSGQERPNSPGDEPLGDGVCVNYETAARMLGVSERTVRRMVADGKLTVLPVGRRRLVPIFALRRLADAAA